MPNVFRQGEHICTLYETAEEQLATAATYLADGLRAGERALYVTDSKASLARFNDALNGLGIDSAAELKRGALVESTHSEVHLVDGRFDCERMLRLLNEAVESALNDGFAGLRTCGDMSWLLKQPPGATQVVEYEALLNQFFHDIRGAGMCQYDCRRLPPRIIDGALATHSSVILEGLHKSNPFHRPHLASLNAVAQPFDLDWKLSELRRRA